MANLSPSTPMDTGIQRRTPKSTPKSHPGVKGVSKEQLQTVTDFMEDLKKKRIDIDQFNAKELTSMAFKVNERTIRRHLQPVQLHRQTPPQERSTKKIKIDDYALMVELITTRKWTLTILKYT